MERRAVDIGYYSYITGEARIDRAIDEKHWPEGDANYGNAVYFGYFQFVVNPGDQTVAVVDGEIKVVGDTSGSIQVNLAFDDNIKAYDFNDQCQALADWAQKHSAVIEGQFDREGEESGDLERIVFSKSGVAFQTPKVLWPGDPGY